MLGKTSAVNGERSTKYAYHMIVSKGDIKLSLNLCSTTFVLNLKSCLLSEIFLNYRLFKAGLNLSMRDACIRGKAKSESYAKHLLFKILCYMA